MPDALEDAVQRWMRRMERTLRGLKEAGDDEALRSALDGLSKQVEAWQLLYRPPPEPVMPMRDAMPLRGFHSRTIGGTN